MDNSKACTKCGQIKNRLDFHKDKSRSDGLFPQCKICVNTRMLEYTREHAEENRAKSKAWYHANKDRAYASKKARLAENKYETAAYQKNYRIKNKTKSQSYARKYYQENKERFLDFGHRRRARMSDRRKVTKKEIIRLLEQPCLYCGAPSEHIDHIVPLSRGGRHSIGNLTGACASCNLSKGSKFITEWKKGKNGH